MSVNDTAGPAVVPETPPPQPQYRRMRWVRGISLAAGVVVIAVGAGFAGASMSHPAAPAPRVSVSAVAQPPLRERLAAWLGGPGGVAASEWAKLAAAGASSDSRMQQLLTLGEVAVKYPCPVDPGDYTAMFVNANSGIRDYFAGDSGTALGKIAAANRYAQAWEAAMAAATATVR